MSGGKGIRGGPTQGKGKPASSEGSNPSSSLTNDKTLHRFVQRLRSLAKRGNGPCAGGGTLDQYSRGRREEAAEWRRLIRELLKELDGEIEIKAQWIWEPGKEPGTVVLFRPWFLETTHNETSLNYALEFGKPETKKMFEAGRNMLHASNI